ncbi:phosphoglycerate mutase, partial [Cognatilysobacter lacus]|uniref:phosphoglycerate mutase n=1 Tax=Cognatilysobacter lacus TaxID=1643323 RepID=UPI0016594531
AVTRQVEAGDAAGSMWLRADPAYVRPDINGARLLAVGEGVGLDGEEAESLLAPLRPLFGDVGMPIEAGSPSAWYLRLPLGSPLPAFASPDDALGADLFEHMPSGPDGRRWRALLSEAQVTLHQHPVNAQRQARGRVPVNSLWFWGEGKLPDAVTTPFARVHSADSTVLAFAQLARATARPLSPWESGEDDVAFDLRHERRLDRLLAHWIEPALADMASKRLDALSLWWADGERVELRRSQSLRFWRRPLRTLAQHEPG